MADNKTKCYTIQQECEERRSEEKGLVLVIEGSEVAV